MAPLNYAKGSFYNHIETFSCKPCSLMYLGMRQAVVEFIDTKVVILTI